MDQAEEFKNQGNTEFRNKNFQKAIDLYTQAIELNPSNHVYYSNRSGSFAGLEDFESSLKDAEKALEIMPDHLGSISRKGFAQLSTGQIDEAIATYDYGLELHPGNDKLVTAKQQAEDAKNGGGPGMGGMGGGMGGG